MGVGYSKFRFGLPGVEPGSYPPQGQILTVVLQPVLIFFMFFYYLFFERALMHLAQALIFLPAGKPALLTGKRTH